MHKYSEKQAHCDQHVSQLIASALEVVMANTALMKHRLIRDIRRYVFDEKLPSLPGLSSVAIQSPLNCTASFLDAAVPLAMKESSLHGTGRGRPTAAKKSVVRRATRR